MKNIFPLRIKDLRAEKGLTQLQLAKILNYTQSNICEWEKGTVEPRADALLAISAYFNVSVDYLLGRTDDAGELLRIGETPQYSLIEQQLIANFRRLPAQTQNYIFGIVQNLANS